MGTCKVWRWYHHICLVRFYLLFCHSCPRKALFPDEATYRTMCHMEALGRTKTLEWFKISQLSPKYVIPSTTLC